MSIRTIIQSIIQGGSSAINYMFTQRVAYALTTYLSAILAALQPAFKVVQITYNYLGLYGATMATSTPTTGSTNWATPANAQGNKNAVSTTLTASLTAAAAADLALAYAAVTGKSAFVIEKVELVFNAALTLGLLQAGGMTYSYKVGAGAFVQIFTTAANFSDVDKAYDITSAIGGDYTKLGTLAIKINGSLGAAAASGKCAVDSVDIRLNTTPITQAA